MVAILGDVKSTRSVRQWVAGEVPPAQDSRLRSALQIADILLTREQPDVVRAWFAGNDPNLNDRNPIMYLIESNNNLKCEAVIAAARKFVTKR
jgi:hypothetical protein